MIVECGMCGREFKLKPAYLPKTRKPTCSVECRKKLPSKAKKYVSQQQNGKDAYVHRLVAARALGKPLPPKAVVHHHDGVGVHNTNNNLVICQNNGYHHFLHARQRIIRAGGNPNTDSWCSACRRPHPVADFYIRKTGVEIGKPTNICKTGFAEAVRRRRA